jgi:peptidoglycan/LPS O-acetylase OafA/YrhL
MSGNHQVVKASSKINFESIDILRGVAILGVFIFHWFGMAFARDHLKWNGLFLDFAQSDSTLFNWLYFCRLGESGVILFFVISGFCIHWSVLQKKENYSTLEFYWKRFWRIYPPYLIALFFFIVIQNRFPTNINQLLQLLPHILLVQNLDYRTILEINGSFWSLAVELQLYLLYPILLNLFFQNRTLIIVVITGLSSVLFSHILPTIFGEYGGTFGTFFIKATPFRFWFYWTFGALIAERQYLGKRLFTRPKLWFLILLPLWISWPYFKPLFDVNRWLETFLFGLLLESTLSVRVKRNLVNRALAFIGTSSYSLYLLHQPLLYPLNQFFLMLFKLEKTPQSSFLIGFPVSLVLLSILSFICFQTVEKVSVRFGKQIWSKMAPL